MNLRSAALLLVIAATLGGCTFLRPKTQTGMPSREDITPGEEITVRRNENVYALARKHGVSMREIIVLNDLKAPFALRSGQKLTLPDKNGDRYGGDAVAMQPSRGGAPVAAPSGTIEAVPLDEPTTQTAAQTAPPPNTLQPPSPPPAKPQTQLQAQTQAQQPRATTVSPPPAKPAQQQAEASGKPETGPEAPHVEAAPNFAWPVQGPIISGFGPKGQGMNNDGVNISAPKGAPVSAAAGGTVVYTGNEMKGFGNLVLVRHEGGWVTAYAHLERVLVSRDTVVAKNDMIGTVGSTGGVSQPQLHFETRQDGKPVDPQRVIR